MSDCRTCIHNTYQGEEIEDWVLCGHPTTLRKTPKWERGDPSWINMLTADLPVSRLDEVSDCPTYESAQKTALESGK